MNHIYIYKYKIASSNDVYKICMQHKDLATSDESVMF